MVGRPDPSGGSQRMIDCSGVASNEVVYQRDGSITSTACANGSQSSDSSEPASEEGARYSIRSLPSTCGSVVMSRGRTSTMVKSVERAQLLTLGGAVSGRRLQTFPGLGENGVVLYAPFTTGADERRVPADHR